MGPQDDTRANRESKAGAGDFPVGESLKGLKDARVVFRGDALPVITQDKMPHLIFLLNTQMNGGRLRRSIPDGVTDEILNQLDKMPGMSIDRRQIITSDDCFRFANCGFQIVESAVEGGIEVNNLLAVITLARLSVRKKVKDQGAHTAAGSDDGMNPRLWVRKVDGDMHVEPPDKQPATRWYPGSSSAKPGSLDELLWCVKNVAAKGPEAEMRATGSHWAMSEASVTPGDMIETRLRMR